MNSLKPLVALEMQNLKGEIQSRADKIFSEEEKVACSLANPEACEACQ